MATLYDTLGVHAHATEDEIKRAYRKAAMKWHPDRNSGAEEVARATFQEIKDAYAILSDAGQRKVYDAVYAEQMRQWETMHARRQKAQAERAATARAADEAAYTEMVSIAMRFADEGHNRDVLFGVLLGRQCETRRAAQIADSVSALQASRREAAAKAEGKGAAAKNGATEAGHEAGRAAEHERDAADHDTATVTRASATKTNATKTSATKTAADVAPSAHNTQGKRDEPADAASPAGALSGLWFQFLNGLRF